MKIVLDTNVFVSGVFFSGVDLDPFLVLLVLEAEVLLAPPLPEPVCADADDDKFFACALAAGCKVIVSGDRHVKDASGYRGITVKNPRQFVDEYLRK